MAVCQHEQMLIAATNFTTVYLGRQLQLTTWFSNFLRLGRVTKIGSNQVTHIFVNDVEELLGTSRLFLSFKTT